LRSRFQHDAVKASTELSNRLKNCVRMSETTCGSRGSGKRIWPPSSCAAIFGAAGLDDERAEEVVVIQDLLGLG
jgi:hypothetical protein